jgi:hypothetical protein
MLRCFFAQLLCVLLALGVPTLATGKTSDKDSKATLQDQLVRIPAGSVIDVKLKSKEKLTGRLGDLSAEAFQVDVANGKSIEKRSIRFDEVKSVQKHGQMSSGAKIALWIGVGAAAAVGVLWAVASAMPM